MASDTSNLRWGASRVFGQELSRAIMHSIALADDDGLDDAIEVCWKGGTGLRQLLANEGALSPKDARVEQATTVGETQWPGEG
jgi:hypothetical protein